MIKCLNINMLIRIAVNISLQPKHMFSLMLSFKFSHNEYV